MLIVGTEKRKRKNGAKADQTYFHTEDGRARHASKFRKVDLKTFIRDQKISQLGI